MYWLTTTLVIFTTGNNLPLACLWDYDTLAMERAAVPTAHEAIVGYFARHSEHYYRWRIEDRSSVSPDDRTPADWDDIAVAHEKLGNHDEAIRVIREKMERFPDQGRYESEANLATFLIHAGRYSEGLEHIDAALAINPDAHFGREIYQKWLVEYFVEQKAAKMLDSRTGPQPFDEYLYWKRNESDAHQQALTQQQSAVEGLLGMIRFGNHTSPVLLSALGDIMDSMLAIDDRNSTNAKRLAARAYLVASYHSSEPASSRYRSLAETALSLQVDETLERTELDLRDELEQTQRLESRIASDEKRWVEEGLNLDTEFAAKYAEIPPMNVSDHSLLGLGISKRQIWALMIIFTIGTVLLFGWKWMRRPRPT